LTVVVLYGLRSEDTGSDTHNNSSIALYTYQQNYRKYSRGSTHYKIVLVADMDKDAKLEKKWKSILKYGILVRDALGHYSVDWTEDREIHSTFNDGARGMELSDLCYFNDHLYTFDDRTGVVFEVFEGEGEIVPVHVLSDGDGKKSKGFKAEWCTVKDDMMYIGGMGKEWTSPKGVLENYDPMWVKVIDREGRIRHLDWRDNYLKLREVTETPFPGYLLHEAVVWNPITHRWLILPRRVSKEIYDEVLDEERCGNIMLEATEDFQTVDVHQNMGPLAMERGFSTVKLIPYREDELLVLKTKEKDSVETFISVITVRGVVLMRETKVGDIKFEGIEIL